MSNDHKRNVVNVLFVCSMNQWRSPTAEKIYADHPALSVRSRGISRKAVRKLTSGDLKWADTICVMERKHRNKIESTFPGEVRYTQIHVLEIPDEYRFMDDELIELIKQTVDPLLEGIEP